jgi:chorismate synthase
MLMQQNARTTAASLLPALTHLPPTMVLPGKKTVEKVLNGEMSGEQVQNNKSGDE